MELAEELAKDWQMDDYDWNEGDYSPSKIPHASWETSIEVKVEPDTESTQKVQQNNVNQDLTQAEIINKFGAMVDNLVDNSGERIHAITDFLQSVPASPDLDRKLSQTLITLIKKVILSLSSWPNSPLDWPESQNSQIMSIWCPGKGSDWKIRSSFPAKIAWSLCAKFREKRRCQCT